MKTNKSGAVNGVRWVIVSPYQVFEHTISRQRKGAWSLFKFFVARDVESYKRQGWRAVKVNVSFKPVRA